MADWQPIEIPHSSTTVIGTRVASGKRFDLFSVDGLLFLAAPFLIAGAIGWEIHHFQQGDLFADNATINATLIGVPLGLVAVAMGIGMLWAPFRSRRFDGACPLCGQRQRWEWPGGDTASCSSCKAAVHVRRNGQLREADLAETGSFYVWANALVGDLPVAEDGHVRPVMPDLCAVCGRQPATTAKPDDRGMRVETETQDPDQVMKRTHDDLAALEIPLCSAHAAQTPVSVRDDRYTFKSYRYYRAFLLVNGIPKNARSNESSRATTPSA